MTDDANRPPAESGRLSRRTFLELSAAAGTLAALGGAGLALAGGDDLLRKKIPASGQKIPVIGLGTARTFGVDPSDAAAMKPLRAVMKRFYDGGGRLVDSSPMYGQAEAVTGKLARDLGITDKLFMATKVWTRGREAGIAEMERSEKLMRGGPLDLILFSPRTATRCPTSTPSSRPSSAGAPKSACATSASPTRRTARTRP